MKKTFDCIEMKRKGSLKVYEALKAKSREPQMEYWRGRNEELQRWLDAKRQSSTPA